ncbi:MAG: TPM domain-containing protein [Bacteroidales bacterium]|nr:TPM domain-containing protein [Bacteroidales bacterium]
MKYIRKYLAAAILLAASLSLYAIPQKPEPQRLVYDFAELLTESQAERLERILVAFDDSTSNQIAVVTVTDLEGMPASEYATRTGIEWKVGSSDFNNGVVILVKPKTKESGGEVAISIGYGLEGAIPDVYCKRIIDNEMIPHFRENDYSGGIYAACEVLMKLASGEISEPRQSDDDTEAMAVAAFCLIILIMIVFFAIISKGGGNSGNGGSGRTDDGDIIARSIIIGNILGHGRRGGSSWGGQSGGGFGGFGGFGGGSFGGGGASGRW